MSFSAKLSFGSFGSEYFPLFSSATITQLFCFVYFHSLRCKTDAFPCLAGLVLNPGTRVAGSFDFWFEESAPRLATSVA
jgi:hypothetical protein